MTPPTVELSMIVKNEEATLARCLASARHVVDRIVVGDTGSQDNTVTIAKNYGAEVFPIPWRDDFSSARNIVLSRGCCDWVLVLDADEMLDTTGAAMLRRSVTAPGIAAYDVWRWNYVRTTSTRSGEQGALPNCNRLPESSKYPAYVKSLNTRLFRRHPGIYFERPVHETVAHRLQAIKATIAEAPFVIHHLGHAEDADAVRTQKNVRYQQIGLSHLEHHPDDARACFELGLGELEHFRNPEAALSFFRRSLDIDENAGSALAFAGLCLVRLTRYDEARLYLLRAKSTTPVSIVLHEALGDSYYHQQKYAEAHAAYTEALRLGSASALIIAKYGLCDIHLGRRASGVLCLQNVLLKEPDLPELLDVVALGFAFAQDNVLAAHIARKRLTLSGSSPFHYLLACTLFRLSGDFVTQREIANEGLAKYPHDPALSAALQNANQ